MSDTREFETIKVEVDGTVGRLTLNRPDWRRASWTHGHLRRVPVLDEGRLVGILTERDLHQYSGYLESTRVNAAMSTALVTVTPHDTMEDAARLMLKHKIGGLPIVAEGKLVGIVTTSDLLKAFLIVVKATSEIMNP